jgi:hypothetical protein
MGNFDIKNMGEYHDLYIKSDVIMLADIFENFRDMGLKYYTLDPAHYITTPSFAFDALLKMTNVQLELITDVDMYNMIEQ